MAEATDLTALATDLEQEPALCPCLEVLVVRDAPLGPPEQDFYDRAMAELRPLLARYVTSAKKSPAKLDEKGLQVVPTWVKRPRLFNRYHALFEEDRDGPSPATLEVMLVARRPDPESPEAKAEWEEIKAAYHTGRMGFSPPATVLRATFPLDGRMADPAALRDWAFGLAAVRDGGLVSAVVGPAVNVDEEASPKDRERAARTLAAVLLRRPGVDWYELSTVFNHSLRWEKERSDFLPLVKRVNWITVVSGRAVERLGGAAGVRERVGPDADVLYTELGPNLAVQAGPAPALGDVGRRDFLPTYRRVAAALRSVRLEAHAGMGRAFSGEAADEWLNGLDRSYE